jgi:predicted RNA-binding protein YlqC (UPF0109 family)
MIMEAVNREANVEAFLRYVVGVLTGRDDERQVIVREGDGRVTFELAVSGRETALLIGGGGSTIEAIRSLASVAAGESDRKISVEVRD